MTICEFIYTSLTTMKIQFSQHYKLRKNVNKKLKLLFVYLYLFVMPLKTSPRFTNFVQNLYTINTISQYKSITLK